MDFIKSKLYEDIEILCEDSLDNFIFSIYENSKSVSIRIIYKYPDLDINVFNLIDKEVVPLFERIKQFHNLINYEMSIGDGRENIRHDGKWITPKMIFKFDLKYI